ncbi:MAG: alkaline phosphatase [candidate division WS1 bacterium]|nr:alkaline phosphatase [candidate division WS1 bacterium]
MNRTVGNLRIFRWALLVGLSLLATSLWAAPRNVILMIGDGMGMDTVIAAGAYKYGNAYHRLGGDQRLAMETLSDFYYCTTFSASGPGYDFTWDGGNREYPKQGPTDSAAAGTALATGVKTYNGAIGMDLHKRPLVSVSEYARQAGMKVGILTSVTFYHATPACFAAHNAGRGNAAEIAREMLMVSQPEVLMGAGDPDSAPPDKAYSVINQASWEAIKAGRTPYRLVQERADFQALIANPPEGKILGVFRNVTALPYCKADGQGHDPRLPTLAEMTRGALAALQNPQGFFLMVEGGAIDWAGHANNLDAAIGETLAFDEAVAAVLEWITAHGGWDENLLIITADHETGYLSSVQPTEAGKLPAATWGTDGKWGSHTNRPVPLFCQGAGSERFSNYKLRVTDFERGLVNVVDNTTVFNVMKSTLPLDQVAVSAREVPWTTRLETAAQCGAENSCHLLPVLIGEGVL